EDRPRTPTDFRDMSKREREVRAKMVLDPLSHKAETFLTGVDTGQYDMFLPFMEVHKVRLKQHWHLQYAQHIHSIAKDQQEFAQHMLAALKGRHPNRK
ncbi:hypothetical protein DYB34_009399, partial [Aphanomyces astaci]